MSLAEKIEKIRTDQENTKKQFMNEVFQGLQQLHAYKTQEEVEAQRKSEQDASIRTGSVTTKEGGVTTTKTSYGIGDTKRTTEDKLTDKDYKAPTKERTYYDNKGDKHTVLIDKDFNATDEFGKPVDVSKLSETNPIHTYSTGIYDENTGKFTPYGGKPTTLGFEAKENIKAVNALKKEIRDLEVEVGRYGQEMKSVITDEDGVVGIWRDNTFVTEKDILNDMNKAQDSIRKKRKQIDDFNSSVDKAIEEKFGGTKNSETTIVINEVARILQDPNASIEEKQMANQAYKQLLKEGHNPEEFGFKKKEPEQEPVEKEQAEPEKSQAKKVEPEKDKNLRKDFDIKKEKSELKERYTLKAEGRQKPPKEYKKGLAILGGIEKLQKKIERRAKYVMENSSSEYATKANTAKTYNKQLPNIRKELEKKIEKYYKLIRGQ